MEDGIEELKERLRLTQMQLQAERETDSLRRQQVSLCLNQDPASHTALNLLNKHISFYNYFQCLVGLLSEHFNVFVLFYQQFSMPYTSHSNSSPKNGQAALFHTLKVDGDLQMCILGFEWQYPIGICTVLFIKVFTGRAQKFCERTQKH